MTSGSVFDGLAARYDELWTNTAAGRMQREAVWRHLEIHCRAGQNILDLGCGTGEDAVHLQQSGLRVTAIDASPAMVRIARERGIAAQILPLEELEWLEGDFDGAISNFGPFNCVANLNALRDPLARLIRPGGFLALCVIGRFCLWETLHFLARGEFRKAARRWSGSALSVSLGLRVHYPTVRQIGRALKPYFMLVQSAGIGVFVPPSCGDPLSPATLTDCVEMDRRLAHLPCIRAMSDHRLLVFERC